MDLRELRSEWETVVADGLSEADYLPRKIVEAINANPTTEKLFRERCEQGRKLLDQVPTKHDIQRKPIVSDVAARQRVLQQIHEADPRFKYRGAEWLRRCAIPRPDPDPTRADEEMETVFEADKERVSGLVGFHNQIAGKAVLALIDVMIGRIEAVTTEPEAPEVWLTFAQLHRQITDGKGSPGDSTLREWAKHADWPAGKGDPIAYPKSHVAIWLGNYKTIYHVK